MANFSTIKVGEPLNVADLQRTSPPRRLSPRDEDLTHLVNEVSIRAESHVLPWRHDGNAATARAVANRVVKAVGATVYVSSRPDMPGVLLFSRVPLSRRPGRSNPTDR